MTVRAVRGFCTLCRSRCGAIFTTDGARILRVDPDPDHPTGGALCAKGRAAPEILADPARLRVPLRRTRPKGDPDPGWHPVRWDEALDDIAGQLRTIRDTAGGASIAFATTTPSGSGIGDSIEWIEAFARQIGSPNILASVETCNFQRDYGQALTFGAPLGAPDHGRADAIVLWGHNPARTWLAQASAIAARKPGAPLVVIDPQRAGSGSDADVWLRIRPGTDGILALGAIRHLIATRSFDEDFVRRWTDAALLVDHASGRRVRIGDDAFAAMTAAGLVAADTSQRATDAELLQLDFSGNVAGIGDCATSFALLTEAAEPWTVDAVASACGLDPDAIARFNALLAGGGRIAYYHWSGLSQSEQSTQTVRAISTLFALRGDVDQPGANRWLKGLPPYPFDTAPLPPALGAERLPLGPPRHGYITLPDLCGAIERGAPYAVNALLSFGSNPLVTQPNADRAAAAFARLPLHVHIDVRETPMAASADYLLPATLPWEHEALRCGFDFSDASAGLVQLRAAVVPPSAEQRPDYAIVRALAQRIGLPDPLWYGPIEAAWDRRLTPLGLSSAALRAQDRAAMVPLDHPVAAYAGQRDDGSVRGFATPSRRVELYSEQLAALGQPGTPTIVAAPVDPAFPLVMSCAKRPVFTHSSYRETPSLRRRAPDPAVALSPGRAAAHAILPDDWCTITTPTGALTMRATIDPDLADDVLIADFGWRGANLNAVVNAALADPVSGSQPMRRTPAAIARDAARSRGNWAGQRGFRLAVRTDAAADIAELTFMPVDGGAVPAFAPGQHVELAFAGDAESRRYSLTSAGIVADRLSIAVRRHDAGWMSRRLHDLAVGDTVLLRPLSGRFRVPLDSRRSILMIAGGIGITPFLSHARTLTAAARATLLHIVTTRDDAPFADELAAAAIDYRLVATRDGGGVPGRGAGILRQQIDALTIDEASHAFLCGPAGFMATARAALIARGVPAGAIEQEGFAAAPVERAGLRPARILLKRSGRRLDWSPEQGSILAAADAAGIVLPNGCRAGQCESCALTIVSGAVRHSSEVVEPDTCLTCCAVPDGDLVLDA